MTTDDNDDEYDVEYADASTTTAMPVPTLTLPTRNAMMSTMRGSHNNNHGHRGVSTRSFFDGLESVDESWDGGDYNNNIINNNTDEMERRKKGIIALYRRENKAVVILRVCLYFGLILTGVLVAVAVAVMFSITNNNNEQQQGAASFHAEEDFPAILYAVIVSSVFCLTFISFVMYNWLVERRQEIVLEQAVQSTALVSTLFPEAVRDRLLKAHHLQKQQQQAGGGESCHDILFNSKDEPATIGMTAEASSSIDLDDDRDGGNGGGDPSGRGGGGDGDDTNMLIPSPRGTPKLRLKSFLRDASPLLSPSLMDTGKPIADFFPHCTVLFADISGFTAWSSQREPTQVFTLLQNLYGVFDKQAKKREVFKVETM